MPQGFFSKAELDEFAPKRPDRMVLGCGACGLCNDCSSSIMEPEGTGEVPILIVGGSPGRKEDDHDQHFVGEPGRFLRQVMRQHGVDLDECGMVYAVNCRTYKIPTDKQIGYCRKLVFDAIDEYDPKVIILLGLPAVKSVIGHRWKKDLGGIERWRGFQIPDRELGAYVCPVYSPRHVQNMIDKAWKQEEQEMYDALYAEDLYNAVQCLDKPEITKEMEERKVEICTNDVAGFLKELRKEAQGHPIAFDYETTGIKPYRIEHEIYSCAISLNSESAVAFPVGSDLDIQDALAEILMDESIPKIAQNMKFEHIWSKEVLGCEVKPWLWDTMIAQHISDNRRGICSFKFQAYVHLGIIDYDSHIKGFLEADAPNELNTIKKANIQDILIYNGMDSMLEYRMYELQRELI